MRRFFLDLPLSLLNGAIPVSATILFRESVSISTKQQSIVHAVISPTPITDCAIFTCSLSLASDLTSFRICFAMAVISFSRILLNRLMEACMVFELFCRRFFSCASVAVRWFLLSSRSAIFCRVGFAWESARISFSWAKRSIMRVSMGSVFAFTPSLLAKYRMRAGLSLAKGMALFASASMSARSYPPVASKTVIGLSIVAICLSSLLKPSLALETLKLRFSLSTSSVSFDMSIAMIECADFCMAYIGLVEVSSHVLGWALSTV